MAKPPNHIELNSTANIWTKKLSQKGVKNVNSGPVSRMHGKDFQKFYQGINMWENREQDINEAGDITKRKKLWIRRNTISTALLCWTGSSLKHSMKKHHWAYSVKGRHFKEVPGAHDNFYYYHYNHNWSNIFMSWYFFSSATFVLVVWKCEKSHTCSKRLE